MIDASSLLASLSGEVRLIADCSVLRLLARVAAVTFVVDGAI